MFVSDVNIQPNHKRKPAMPPGSPLFGVRVCHGWVEAVLGITSSIWLRNNCAHKSLCVNTYSGAPPPAIRSARLQVTRGDGLPAVVNPAPSITTYPKKW
jgi:hypothetical protein